MSWFDKLFGEDDKSTSTRRSSQKRSHQSSKADADDALIPQSNDIYQRPRGKFRFPIDMHDAHQQKVESHATSSVNYETTHTHVETDKRPAFTLDRKQRRHRNGVRVKGIETQSSSNIQVTRSNALSTHYRRPTTQYRANGEREDKRQQEVRPTYHRPDFKASEVPSAIFGTKARREIKNSGLKQPVYTQSDKTNTTRNTSQPSRKAPVKRPTYQKQATPNYSKRDNTINIENIYASQIVEEIRREREKKVLQKKRFKASLEQKKAAQQKEDGGTIQQAIDAMHAQQAKQLLGSAYDADANEEKDILGTVDMPEVMDTSVQDDDATSHEDQYQYEEVNLSQFEDVDAHEPVEDTSAEATTTDQEKADEIDTLNQDVSNEANAYDYDTSDEVAHTESPVVEQHAQYNANDDITQTANDEDTHDTATDVTTSDSVGAEEETLARREADVVTDTSDDTTVLETHVQDVENTEREQQETDVKRPVVAPVLKPTIAQHESSTSVADEETVQAARANDDETEAHAQHDESAEVTMHESQHTPQVERDEVADDKDDVEAVAPTSDVKAMPEGKVNEGGTARDEAAAKVPSAKPIRRGSRPFNVVMTPSDKKRHMERQQQQMENRYRPQESATTEKGQSQPSQQSAERVTSPELVDTTHVNVQQKTQQATPVAEKKIRRGPSLSLPSVELLDAPEVHERDESWIAEKKQELNDAFYYFNVPAEVVNVIEGPSVTRFELSVEKGVKVSRITALQDDIKMALAAKDIRIEAPIPGTSLVGIEVPNQNPMKVNLRAIIESESFKNASSKLTVAMGNRINNEPLLMDIAKTPHALIAGATGSGKSVSINSILISLLYRNHPEELKLLLIDPKMVELAPYNDLPHLVAPVITDVKAATQSLKWAVDEMERRYKLFAQAHVRNITAFNKKVSYDQRIPKIVIVIDELADLMMMAPQEVEQSIARLAQKARACGIHMLVATQRPSVNVITGLIKANIPTRIAFMVSSSVDSRTILDSGGAERLLGYGDMLYLGGGMNKPIRVQGTFVSDDEIDRVVDSIKAQRGPEYLFQEQELLKKTETPAKDELFYEVCEFMVREQSISTSLIQRHFQIGYNRAARIIDQLEQLGYISGANGSKPRDVYLTETELNEL
ncbi:cell division protein FtsK [Staphylococcus microti]|uniref:Cell division protein FtsK n=1 Tax=Staphylococcus microti TaxID=569857 RepID=A0A0D6XN76_9STAP|nr:DNA translocase FtsK [Staphylococcus microti]KIX90102.1 cell division protein FtsK [Staphylococcus microti]PNZ76968.1 DNA translocase FtsK [Staphylococcus microti]SUM57767.1 cell division protein FtsK [Staphylococcus microti]